MYKSRVQRGPLVVQKVSGQLRSVLLAHSYISGKAQPSWNKHRLGEEGKAGVGVGGVGGQAQRYDITRRRQFTTKHHNVQRAEK